MKTIFLFIFLFSLSSCYKEDDYLLSHLDDDILDIAFELDSIPADGVSWTTIYVEVPYDTKKEFSKITLKTSNGKFENSQQEIEATISKVVIDGVDKKIAKSKIISTQKVEDANIEITIGDLYKSKILKFYRAYPTEIKTDLPSLAISYGYQTINLTTKLNRPIGKPSIMSKATLVVVDSLGNSMGQFLNYNENVDDNGILTNQLSLGTKKCNCNKVLIISETQNSKSTTIRDTVSLTIN